MALPPNLDREKLSEAALAILGLNAFSDHEIVRAWKGLLAEEFLTKHFGK